MSKTQISVADSLKALQASCSDHTQEVYEVRQMPIGHITRQGDIYIRRVADDFPHGKPRADKQLALGSTKGARHMAEGDVQLFDPDTDDRLAGPIVVAPKGWHNSHPEHSHYVFSPGTYETGRQLDTRTKRAVSD